MPSELTDDVRELYDAYPYPSPIAGGGLIRDVANLIAFLFTPATLAGKTVLDAGCGSGHRLVALAKMFPGTRFLGIDLAAGALEVAHQLASRHAIENVRFAQRDLLQLDPAETFDLIVSTGVIHHLTDPRRGVANLSACLAPGGCMLLWLYHAYGEFDRLLQRELVRMLWDPHSMSLQEGIEMIRDLDVSLARDRYSGAFAARDNAALDNTAINVDAFLNPVVNAYRFDEAVQLMDQSCLDWYAIHSISLGRETKLLDLAQAARKSVAMFCLKASDLFEPARVRERYERVANREKLRVIELMTKPNGFVVATGREHALPGLDARMQGNLLGLRS